MFMYFEFVNFYHNVFLIKNNKVKHWNLIDAFNQANTHIGHTFMCSSTSYEVILYEK